VKESDDETGNCEIYRDFKKIDFVNWKINNVSSCSFKLFEKINEPHLGITEEYCWGW